MQVEFSSLLLKDLRKVPQSIQCAFAKTVQKAQVAQSVRELNNCKKLQGVQDAYRIRIRDYRVTFLFVQQGNKVFFQRIFDPWSNLQKLTVSTI